jgi:hypothetical protein
VVQYRVKAACCLGPRQDHLVADAVLAAHAQAVSLVLQEEPLSPLQEDFRALRRTMLQKGTTCSRSALIA